ncbi:MAG: right-handed parallel beta-helix repeat-containing protein, partial [Candidatus Anstonellales archaeon]
MRSLLIFSLLLIAIFSYSNICTCSDFSSCDSKLNDPACWVVSLDRNITLNDNWDILQIPSNKEFNCNNHTINANLSKIFLLSNVDNVTIRNCTVDLYAPGKSGGNDNNGIEIYNSQNIRIINFGVWAYTGFVPAALFGRNVTNLTASFFHVAYVSRINIADAENVILDVPTQQSFLSYSLVLKNINNLTVKMPAPENVYFENITNAIYDLSDRSYRIVSSISIISSENISINNINARIYNTINLENSKNININQVVNYMVVSRNVSGLSIRNSIIHESPGSFVLDRTNNLYIENLSIFNFFYDGFILNNSENITIRGLNFNGYFDRALVLENIKNITIKDSNFLDFINRSILLKNVSDIEISSSTIESNADDNLFCYVGDIFKSKNILFYNNRIKIGLSPFVLSDTSNISFNIQLTPGINIINKNILGGNYWANVAQTGFSETCNDNDGNFICDSPYQVGVDEYNNNMYYDNYPLTGRETVPPDIIAPNNSISIEQLYFPFNLYDDSGLSLLSIEINGSHYSTVSLSGTTYSGLINESVSQYGNYSIRINATDIFNNINSKTYNIRVIPRAIVQPISTPNVSNSTSINVSYKVSSNQSNITVYFVIRKIYGSNYENRTQIYSGQISDSLEINHTINFDNLYSINGIYEYYLEIHQYTDINSIIFNSSKTELLVDITPINVTLSPYSMDANILSAFKCPIEGGPRMIIRVNGDGIFWRTANLTKVEIYINGNLNRTITPNNLSHITEYYDQNLPAGEYNVTVKAYNQVNSVAEKSIVYKLYDVPLRNVRVVDPASPAYDLDSRNVITNSSSYDFWIYIRVPDEVKWITYFYLNNTMMNQSEVINGTRNISIRYSTNSSVYYPRGINPLSNNNRFEIRYFFTDVSTYSCLVVGADAS